MMIPAALTGRSLIELFTIYMGQADTYRRLSEHAPNLYLLMPDALYTPGVVIGVVTTVLIALTWTAI